MFEVVHEGYPVRQIEVYANGYVLTYDRNHVDDQYGGQGEDPLDASDFAPFEKHTPTVQSMSADHVIDVVPRYAA